MRTRVILDDLAEWSSTVEAADDASELLLPAVDTITFYSDTTPVIALIVPDQVSDNPQVFVDVGGMSTVDRLAFDLLLHFLQISAYASGFNGQLQFVEHTGGLNYDLTDAQGNVLGLAAIPSRSRAALLAVLHAIAVTCVDHIDWEASRIRTAVDVK
jgi:hypothetical protein